MRKTKIEQAEARKQQRKLFKHWKQKLGSGKLNNTQATRRAKSLSRKFMSIE